MVDMDDNDNISVKFNIDEIALLCEALRGVCIFCGTRGVDTKDVQELRNKLVELME